MNPWENWSTDFDERAPIYSQIVILFCRSFVKGEIKAGDRIPSIRDMALTLKVNANTIQRTYQEMERSELINSKRGTGYFFTEDKGMIEKISNSMARESMTRFLKEMRALGYPDKQIINELEDLIKGGESNSGSDTGKGN